MTVAAATQMVLKELAFSKRVLSNTKKGGWKEAYDQGFCLETLHLI